MQPSEKMRIEPQSGQPRPVLTSAAPLAECAAGAGSSDARAAAGGASAPVARAPRLRFDLAGGAAGSASPPETKRSSSQRKMESTSDRAVGIFGLVVMPAGSK